MNQQISRLPNYNSDMTAEIKPGPKAILQTGFQTP